MLKFLFYLLILITFPITFISCQSEEKKEENAGEKKKYKDVEVKDGKSLLWKIEGNGLEKPSYLFGTMHLIEEEYWVFPESLEERVKDCDRLVMEVEDISNAAGALDLMKAKEGETLKDMFTPEQYDSLMNIGAEAMGMGKEAFEKVFGGMKPFGIISAMSKASFKGATKSYEMTLISLANLNKIEKGGLETIEQQLGFFDQIPAEKMKTIILETMKTVGEDNGEMEEMMKIYKEQDLDKLGKFMIEQSPEMMENEEVLLKGRNKAWIPKIEEFAKSGQNFIAVGAAHLVGDEGVINLLREKGYTLTPIRTDK
ncbi:MAG: TraB/GumN family protein [Crocinitomicaceae bacterium]